LTFNLAGLDTTLAVGYQGTEEAIVLGLPKTRTLVPSRHGLTKIPRLLYNTYVLDEDYGRN